MQLRFDDHPSFHRAALGMVGGAALAAPACAALGAGPQVASILGLTAGAALAYHKRWGRAAVGGTAVAIAVLASTGGAIGAPTLVAIAALSGLVLALGLRGPRALLTIGLGALVTVTSLWASHRVMFAQETALWPAWATATAAGAAAGMVGLLGLLPRHLSLVSDPVAAALRRLPTGLDAEVRALCQRSAAIWRATGARLAPTDPGRGLVRDGVLQSLEVAARSVTPGLDAAADTALAGRITDLDGRIAAATDAEVRIQYTAARAALEDQRTYRGRLRQGRERLVARLHNHVAALEKFQLAALGLEAVRGATRTDALVEQLEALSLDVAASGEALAELELPASDAAPATPAEVAPAPAAT